MVVLEVTTFFSAGTHLASFMTRIVISYYGASWCMSYPRIILFGTQGEKLNAHYYPVRNALGRTGHHGLIPPDISPLTLKASSNSFTPVLHIANSSSKTHLRYWYCRRQLSACYTVPAIIHFPTLLDVKKKKIKVSLIKTSQCQAPFCSSFPLTVNSQKL